MRIAVAGSSSIATTSDAATISTRAGGAPFGRCSAIASGRADEQDVDVARVDGRERARDDFTRARGRRPSRRSRSRSTRIRFQLLDVEDLASSVLTAIAAHGVREPRRTTVRAKRMRRRLETHVRRLARPGRRSAHLALRDGHRVELLGDRDREVERPQGRPTGVEFLGFAVALGRVVVDAALRTQTGAVGPAQGRGREFEQQGVAHQRLEVDRCRRRADRSRLRGAWRSNSSSTCTDAVPVTGARQRLHAACHGAAIRRAPRCHRRPVRGCPRR